MKMILIILIFTTSTCIAQENLENNIKTYCKVWGVCKYYSNTDDIDWDNVFFNQYDALLAAKNDEELNVLLTRLIEQTKVKEETIVDDDLKFSITDFYKLKKNKNYILKADFNWIFNSENIDIKNQQLLASLLKTYRGKVPKTISIKSKIPEHNKELVYKEFNNKIALLALLRFYNVMEYYYPYKDLLDKDWDSALTLMIPEFLNCHNISQYKDALNHFSSFLQDSHVGIDFGKLDSFNSEQTKNIHAYYPIKLDYINNKLYVSNILNDSISRLYKIKIGDEISSVNHQRISTVLRKAEQHYSYSIKEDGYFAMLNYLRNIDTLQITVNNRDIVLHKVEVNKDQFLDLFQYYKLSNTLEESNIELDKTIGYVYLPTSKYSSIDNIFRKFKNKKTIILDCRGYGTMAALKLPKLLSKNKMDVASSYLPTKKLPGVFEKQKDETYYISNSIDLVGKFLFGYKKKVFPTFNKPYEGNVVVLIDDNAISFGETVIMIVKTYAKNSVLIGRPTAGANGNVSTLTLPLGGVLDYTAVDFKFANGTEVQRRGIQPDIYVPKTVEAIVSGKDEILNVALKYIKSGN